MFATKKDKKAKDIDEKKKEEEAPEQDSVPPSEEDNQAAAEDLAFLLNLGGGGGDNTPKLRATGIYGDINEERCSEVLYSMLLLEKSGKQLEPSNPDDPESELIETYEPFEFYISTYGGSALDMFGLYDVMRQIKQNMPIHTIGLGKVMSAGTLLLAAGTKGHRRVGKYCRIMIHGVISGQHGHLADIENEFDEAKMTQKMYIRALAEETDMTEKYIRNLIKKKSNVYLSAEEAVDLGLADIII